MGATHLTKLFSRSICSIQACLTFKGCSGWSLDCLSPRPLAFFYFYFCSYYCFLVYFERQFPRIDIALVPASLQWLATDLAPC
ncbi:hypothetical protein I7I50_05998 [Histoplasma capsulatum G186AR]|uniref:Uncharacterized protein n=1 Tax=Ajellomyces capsulatus TaxID=5037 RepID=A0A8H7Z003_AJECA|nr:hypothetical protein I7I52_08737 [Histoplasma capsulatum]QSS67036.1 hypothetical protein I7I50_05998 [Histoplasma capsulatum G186AR]